LTSLMKKTGHVGYSSKPMRDGHTTYALLQGVV
jgi:hypothetical protein